jgi:putative hydrolase of the HAD superfamily
MLRDLLWDASKRRSPDAIKVLGAYRRIRERLADEEAADFDRVAIDQTAHGTGCHQATVQAIVHEWIDKRPLRHLARCRYPHVAELFAGLRRGGKIVGVLSDYPAKAKLAALGLHADHVVCAGDEGVGLLKPNPRGLAALMEAADATPETTALIGDRAARDGAAARRIGAWPLIRSRTPLHDWQSFARFDDALFRPFLGAA